MRRDGRQKVTEMEIQRRELKFEIRATSGDGSTGDGIANAFYTIDSYGTMFVPGSFTQDLPFFLSDGFIAGLNHDWDNPIGVPTDARELPEGLLVAWKLSATEHGKDVMTLLKDKVVRRLSIGFSTLGYQWLETADEVMSFWESKGYTPNAEDIQEAQYGCQIITRAKVYETSPVMFGSNRGAIINNVRAKRPVSSGANRTATDRLRFETARLRHKLLSSGVLTK